MRLVLKLRGQAPTISPQELNWYRDIYDTQGKMWRMKIIKL
jgi:hypothetical protein